MDLIRRCYRLPIRRGSIVFYEALGLEKRRELPIRDEAINYFLGVPGKDQPELEPRFAEAEHGTRRCAVDFDDGWPFPVSRPATSPFKIGLRSDVMVDSVTAFAIALPACRHDDNAA